MRLISVKSVVQIYLSLNKQKFNTILLQRLKKTEYSKTFSLKVKRTAHNGKDVSSIPIYFFI